MLRLSDGIFRQPIATKHIARPIVLKADESDYRTVIHHTWSCCVFFLMKHAQEVSVATTTASSIAARRIHTAHCESRLSFHHLSLSLDSKLSLGEVCLSLLLLLSDSLRVLGRQSPTNSTGLLGSQVEREVLLLCVELAERVALVGIDDGEGAGYGFAEVMAVVILVSDLVSSREVLS